MYQNSQGACSCSVLQAKQPTEVDLAAEIRMFWHPQGDFVAVQVDRYTKTRKSTYTSFELFSVKDRDIPMEVLELPNKTDKVTDFAWEPKVSYGSDA